ncbi:MAG: hypothetical protein HY226_00360 [Candidatus Vogelbacteria bacterium]|nr:hypothetical protein [Candidatus Vogelbacteria bacterium]
MSKLSRKKVYELIDGERKFQDTKWPQDPSLPPSDEMRVIKKLLQLADDGWYITQDNLVAGTKVNPADLEAARKIAGVCVRLMENWGAPRRKVPENITPVKPKRS